MWVRFHRAFLWTPASDRRYSLEYQAGERHNVKRECADAAIMDGAAERCAAPRRDDEGEGKP